MRSFGEVKFDAWESKGEFSLEDKKPFCSCLTPCMRQRKVLLDIRITFPKLPRQYRSSVLKNNGTVVPLGTVYHPLSGCDSRHGSYIMAVWFAMHKDSFIHFLLVDLLVLVKPNFPIPERFRFCGGGP